MDYKSRNPQPPIWSEDAFVNAKEPDPYDHRGSVAIAELDAPDRSVCYLRKIFSGCPVTGEFRFYAVEAPRGCPPREAFEWGEISWREFWTEREWRLRIHYPFDGGPAVSQYITPRQLDRDTIERFKRMDHRGPYHSKLEQLEHMVERPRPEKGDSVVNERIYGEYIALHGHRLVKKVVLALNDTPSSSP